MRLAAHRLAQATLVGVAALAALASVAPALAARRQLWTTTGLSGVASGISGVPLQVNLEDDWNEWASYLSPGTCVQCVMGFTYVLAPPGTPLYHQLFLNPRIFAAFQSMGGANDNLFEDALAILALTHESMHQKLYSIDEGRVQACAVQAFPQVIQTYFNVPEYNTRTIQIPNTVTSSKTVPRTKTYFVNVNGRRVRKTKTVWLTTTQTTTTYTTETQTVDNPTYDALVQDVAYIHSQDTPPYNSNTCW